MGTQDFQNYGGNHVLRNTLVGLVVFVVILGVLVGGWLGGWWLKSANTNRQSVIDQQNYGSQLAYISKVGANMTEYSSIQVQLNAPGLPASEKEALLNQSIAMISDTCRVGRLITTPPSDEKAWLVLHCQ